MGSGTIATGKMITKKKMKINSGGSLAREGENPYLCYR